MPDASLRASVGGEAGISLLAAAYEAVLAFLHTASARQRQACRR
jgi:hypothetical protein